MAQTLLKVSGLKVAYGGIQAVKGVSFEVREGELVSLIGANGAGKTTTLKAITGLQPPAAGSIEYLGKAIKGQGAWDLAKQGLVMVPEGRLLFRDQTVEDNLILGAYLHGGLNQPASRSMLEKVFEIFPRLKERLHQQAGSMSGGEQQMLAIARGLMARPDLLVIDELSLGLAPKNVDQLMKVLTALNKEGLTILLVEQLASYALAIADYGFVVANGRIAHEGPSAALSRNPDVMEAFLGKKKLPTNLTSKPQE